MRSRCRGRARGTCALWLGAIAVCGLAASTPTASASGSRPAGGALASTACITTLPLITSVPSRFAIAYSRVVPVTVTSRGPLIRKLRLVLYTFSGDLLGEGHRSSLSGSAVVRVRLRFDLQPGEYTLYSEGEPNADPSCGPKHRSSVIRFRTCITRLPVTFPEPPGGSAAAYGEYLSFSLRSKGPLIRRLRVSLSNFEGELFGTARVPVLFGTVPVDVRLNQRLRPGGYTITVGGWIASQPASCGPKTTQQTLTFTK